MLRVQSAGSPCRSELCKAVSGCGCAGFTTSLARSMNRDLSFYYVGDTPVQFASGLAAEGGLGASRRERFHRALQTGGRVAPAVQRWAMVEVLRHGADIFCRTMQGPRREIDAARSTEALQSSTSADFSIAGSPISALRKPDSRNAGASLRCLHGRKRGMRLC